MFISLSAWIALNVFSSTHLLPGNAWSIHIDGRSKRKKNNPICFRFVFVLLCFCSGLFCFLFRFLGGNCVHRSFSVDRYGRVRLKFRSGLTRSSFLDLLSQREKGGKNFMFNVFYLKWINRKTNDHCNET